MFITRLQTIHLLCNRIVIVCCVIVYIVYNSIFSSLILLDCTPDSIRFVVQLICKSD